VRFGSDKPANTADEQQGIGLAFSSHGQKSENDVTTL